MAIITIPRILQEKLTEEGAPLETAEERFEKRLQTVKDELKVEIVNVEKHLVKWMFIFWMGQFASIVGILTAILFAFFKR